LIVNMAVSISLNKLEHDEVRISAMARICTRRIGYVPRKTTHKVYLP
jgi:hypothetical protein